MKRYLAIIIFLLPNFLFSSNIDSLFSALGKAKGSQKARILLNIAEYYFERHNDSAVYYLNQVEKFLDKTDKNFLAKWLTLKAQIAYDSSYYSKAILLSDSAISLADDITIKNKARTVLAGIYNKLGLYSEAYKIYRDLIKYYVTHPDTLILSKLYSNIGNVFHNLGNLDSALYYSYKVLEIDSLRKDTVYMIIDYINLSANFNDSIHSDSIIFYLNKALELSKEINNEYFLGTIYLNFGVNNFKAGNYQKAAEYFKQAAKYFKLAHLYDNLTYSLLDIVESYVEINQLDSAKVYYDTALNYISSLKELSSEAKTYYLTYSSDYYYAIGNYKKAYDFLSKYLDYKDSLDLVNQHKELVLYNLRNKVLQDKLKSERYQKLVYKTRLFRVIVIITLLLLVIVLSFSIFIFVSYRKLKISAQHDAIFAILYEIRRIASRVNPLTTSLEELLQKSLDKILSSNKLNIYPKGAIYIKNDNGELVLVAHKNVDEIKEKCQKILPSECIIGKAIEQKKPLIIRNDPKNMCFYAENLHYIAPLIVNKEVLGVIIFYIKPKKFDEKQAKLLETLYLEISFIIDRYLQQQKIKESSIQLNKLNQTLFAQNLKIEENNRQLAEAYKKLDEQSKLLSETLDKMHDSILFASHLMDSLSPSEIYLKEILGENYFILFKPKDIIGGDFYFIEKVGTKLFVILGDATGHGVPGAILAAQTITFIRHFIIEEKKSNPAEILTELRVTLKSIFKHTTKISSRSISVELAMCVIDLQQNILSYSGAFLPAYIVRNEELIILTPTRNPIGEYVRELEFKEYTLQLQNDDTIYLTSDGYQDQLNIDNKKFMRKNLKKVFLQISSLPMNEQKEILESILEQWKGAQEQTDDITVIGIRYKIDTKYILRM